MSNPAFQALLKTNTSNVEKPKPMPGGHYKFRVDSYEFGEANNEKKTPYLQLNVMPVEAGSDVDQDVLAEVKNWTARKMNAKIYVTEDSLWRLVENLAMLGIDTEDREIEEMIPEVVGCEVVAFVKSEVSKKRQDEMVSFIDDLVGQELP